LEILSILVLLAAACCNGKVALTLYETGIPHLMQVSSFEFLI